MTSKDKEKPIHRVIRPSGVNSGFKRATMVVEPPPQRSSKQIEVVTGHRCRESEKRPSMSQWWEKVHTSYGRYHCYVVFLMLESDEQSSRYLSEYGRELDIISGDNCLVVVFGHSHFKRVGFDEGAWKMAVDEHIRKGYSLRIAQLFEINYSDFPCLVIFSELRTSKHVKVTLKEMTAEQINATMREVFWIIDKAVSHNNSPLSSLERQGRRKIFTSAGKSIIGSIRQLTEKTFETAIMAFIEKTI